MTNSTSDINTENKVSGKKLETVTSFKHLGSVITVEGSKPKILSRITQVFLSITTATDSFRHFHPVAVWISG